MAARTKTVELSEDEPQVPEGIRLSEPREAEVGDYPPRPYVEALSEEHRERLAKVGQLPQ